MGGFGYLQDEILVQIFHKLAPKIVVRCKLVSKRWDSLISDPFFTSKYNPSSIPNCPTSFIIFPEYCAIWRRAEVYEANIGLGYDQPRGVVQHVSIDLAEKGSGYIKVLGSWNGLVALYDGRRGFCLLNPLTKEEKTVRVGFDIGPCFDLCGLCHDPAKGEYKAVLSNCGSASTCFYVVSFKGDGDCTPRNQPPATELLNWPHKQGYLDAVVKGVPHWINGAYDHARDSVIYFDPVLEEFGVVRFPDERALVGLGALDGQLTVAVRGRLDQGVLEVWALEEEGRDSWKRLFCMVNDSPYGRPSSISLPCWITHEQVLIIRHQTYLTLCNVREQRVLLPRWLRCIERRFKTQGRAMLTRKTVIFIPTLLSPNQCTS